MTDLPEPIPVLETKGIRKAFPGVQAIRHANFLLFAGEIHSLVGENGAGKSTLLKILTGVHQPDEGIVRLFGREASFSSPAEAQRSGIAAIYQEFTLVPQLSVSANLFLGREKTTKGFILGQAEIAAASNIFQRLGVRIDPSSKVAVLPVAQQQLVEIARALLAEARILIMDEPTAALAPHEVEKLFVILKELAAQGIAIIFVSHRLDEVLEISDRTTVMRDGSTVITRPTASLNRRLLIEHMVGRSLESEFPKISAIPGSVRLEVRNLSGGKVRDCSFFVKAGEVLGIAGLMGAGRTELARLIFGADPRMSGELLLDGQPLHLGSPRDAIHHGICLLTEDRKGQGLILQASAKDNFAVSNLKRWSRFGFIRRSEETSRFTRHVENLNIRLAHHQQRADSLSGGNQQKLLIARWLESDSQVIIFDEPTRGIDVGAKYEMYLLINQLAAQGKVIIIISSELPEILGMSDRVLVMKNGTISGEISDVRSATQEHIMAMAV